MREPAFWRRPGALAGWLLAPLAMLYGAVAGWRMRRAGAAAGVPVICIGNLTAGGAGKTPAAMAAAQLLQEAGQQPFVLSRGYGGRLAGPVRVDPAKHTAADVGDEPLLLARIAPTIVCRDRVAGASAARAAGADVIVMDDGFQNPSLRKDASLVVIDAQAGIGNGLVFPAGPLRAPLGVQLEKANALLVVGEGAAADAVVRAASGLPVLRARLQPDPQAVAALRAHRALAFAGIGDPEKFFRTLDEAGIAAPVRRGFPDHHRFSAREAAELLAQADREGLTLVTTEKDLARLAGEPGLRELAARAKALPVRLLVSDAELFRGFVLGAARR